MSTFEKPRTDVQIKHSVGYTCIYICVGGILFEEQVAHDLKEIYCP